MILISNTAITNSPWVDHDEYCVIQQTYAKTKNKVTY
ncbi:hypothetical protein Pan161_54990 [Gimesia algae]|uniref:Uncharacterized protein n=1 Tax=Gimesia algae TaxID=2527971 RepID=A0A517VLB8_9PLAN|nr:hypothetical protein Pan161_54990 [Gimesia algae]